MNLFKVSWAFSRFGITLKIRCFCFFVAFFEQIPQFNFINRLQGNKKSKQFFS